MTSSTKKLTIVAIGLVVFAGQATSFACKGRRVSYAPRVYYAPQYQRVCAPRVVSPPPRQPINQVPVENQIPQQGQQADGSPASPQPGVPVGTQAGGLDALGQTQTAAPATANDSAETTALQILSGMSNESSKTGKPQVQVGGSQSDNKSAASSSPVQTSNGRVGTWVASLPNQATVRLDLRADGSFLWTATNGRGRKSNFEGSYRLDASTLTLVRSSDSQQLAGKLTDVQGGFNFNLGGSKDSGLNFTRAS